MTKHKLFWFDKHKQNKKLTCLFKEQQFTTKKLSKKVRKQQN